MSLLSVIFILVYTILLGTIIFSGYFFQISKEKKYSRNSQNQPEGKVELKDLIVIVPFRNEALRIKVLLDSIQNAILLPKEFVFVDDHSTDKGAELISAALAKIPHRILKIPENCVGKKQAIRFAINDSNSKYILSMDADVEFNPDYFFNLESLGKADMCILPAIMKAKRWYEHLYEVDLILVNASNCAVAGWTRPIMASGANLLYRRSCFEQFDRFEKHAHMPSGDDIYLLRDFREANAEIQLITDTKVAVYTETPQSLREFIHQRLRWIAKTGDVKDHLSTILAIVQIILSLSFVSLLIYYAVSNEWKQFWIVYLLKTTVDLCMFLPYFNRIKRMISWLLIPVYELIFPIYTLVILGMMYLFKPVWKGRKLDVNY